MAVPMRTSVAPSSSARSRSSDIPIDSVSKRIPLSANRKPASLPGSASAARRARESPSARASAAAATLRSPLRVPSPGQAQRRSCSPRRNVDLDENVERRELSRAAAPRGAVRSSCSQWLHPVETLGGDARLVRLERTDQMPFERRQLLHFLHRLDVILTERHSAPLPQFAGCARHPLSLGNCQQSHPGTSLRCALTTCRFSAIPAIMR